LADALSRSYDTAIDARTVGILPTITSLNTSQSLQMEAKKRGKRIPEEEERIKLIKDEHPRGHFSVEAMFRKLWNQGVWWPGIRNDLKHEVSTCLDCLRYNIAKEGFHPLHSIEADAPWDHLEIDLIGPLDISSDGSNYILTIVDVLSGFTLLRALKTKAMDEMARTLWITFCDYGPPKILQSDNGTEFVNSIIGQLSQLYGIDHQLITPYHPRANGLVE
jgi:transposase InsO family protein